MEEFTNELGDIFYINKEVIVAVLPISPQLKEKYPKAKAILTCYGGLMFMVQETMVDCSRKIKGW